MKHLIKFLAIAIISAGVLAAVAKAQDKAPAAPVYKEMPSALSGYPTTMLVADFEGINALVINNGLETEREALEAWNKAHVDQRYVLTDFDRRADFWHKYGDGYPSMKKASAVINSTENGMAMAVWVVRVIPAAKALK